jgi:hypothetical protein
MDRLNPLDALFVDAEEADRHTSMAIASIAVFESRRPDLDVLDHGIEDGLAELLKGASADRIRPTWAVPAAQGWRAPLERPVE